VVQLSPSSEDAAVCPTVVETATKRPVLLHAIPFHKEEVDIVLEVQLIPSVEDAATVPVCDTATKSPAELHVTAPHAAPGITRAVQLRPSSDDAATVEFVLLTATKRPVTGLHATDIQFWAAMERKNQVIPSFEYAAAEFPTATNRPSLTRLVTDAHCPANELCDATPVHMIPSSEYAHTC